MNYLLDQKREHEAACEKAIREGRTAEASFHAAKAAEFALALAERTDPLLAGRYIDEAEEWMAIAERVRQMPAASRSAPDTKSSHPHATRDQEDAEASQPDEWLITRKPTVTFDQIAGMETAKQAIREMIVYPLRHPETARALGLKPGGGVLLYGPPGNGKTMLGKAIACELEAPFYYASGAQIRSKWHGESEQRLRAFLRSARQHSVAVVFFDEVDGLLPRRSGNSVVDNRIVTQFLAEIGGFDEAENVLLLLGATNKPWDIDEAVFRTGRFDQKIYIGLPDEAARVGILRMHLDAVSRERGFSLEEWARRFEGYAGSDIVGIVNAAKRRALARSCREGSPPVLQSADLEEALKSIPRSVTERMLKQYDEFARQRF